MDNNSEAKLIGVPSCAEIGHLTQLIFVLNGVLKLISDQTYPSSVEFCIFYSFFATSIGAEISSTYDDERCRGIIIITSHTAAPIREDR